MQTLQHKENAVPKLSDVSLTCSNYFSSQTLIVYFQPFLAVDADFCGQKQIGQLLIYLPSNVMTLVMNERKRKHLHCWCHLINL